MSEEQRMKALAREILILSRNTLLVNLRFLDAALSQFVLISLPGIDVGMGTDGHWLCYDPREILLRYRKEKETAVRDYLHLVLHCVFRHMYISTLVDQTLWNLACDMAVEDVMNSLNLSCTTCTRQRRQTAILEELRRKVKQLTAEKLYTWYLNHPLETKELKDLTELFRGDNHKLWYLTESEKQAMGIGVSDHHSSQKDPKQQSNSTGKRNQNKQGNHKNSESFSRISMEQIWKEISQRMQMDLETFSKLQGDRAGALTQNLKAINRERYDYTGFLKKFAVRGEIMKLNPDEFDYIFYTYGLKLYEKMPLIEPLEYKEVKRIREFVIAIDTSGSVSGELVQTFVQKTYNILKSTESFFSKINLHIIQCDANIQEDVRITNQTDFDAYLKTMKIWGLGGTDFRPVFDYVDALCRQKEFKNLKGLIYFTDGYGTFPAKKPAYETAFVFVEDGYNNPDVPPWAIKLILQKDEI